ncbi:MAG: hypothetical protein SGI74_12660 [Oligoflexia bacterium]|nr:hypothetical protein [Oligoflexia bacterium]
MIKVFQKSVSVLFVFCLFFSTQLIQAAEALKVEFDDMFFQSQVHVQEPSLGGIDPLLWRVGFTSRFVQWAHIKASVGASQLLYRPYWAAPNAESVSMTDVTGTIHTYFGDIYAGQFRIPWGLQSQDETELWLPRTLLYERGFFPLRDTGVGFHVDLDGHYMDLAVHNGEGANLTSNQDNRVFVTGQWGLKGPAHSNLGLSATSGRFIAIGTPYETRIRGLNAFFGFNIFGLGLQLEGSIFQTFSQIENTDSLIWHADLEHPIFENINLIGRYEQLNPNTKVVSNVMGRGYLGGEYHSKDNVSRLFLFFVKNNESIRENPNDMFLLIWRLAPAAQ